MLAQNFKTAADLGISDIELQSLIKVLGMLERNELQHGKYPGAGMARGSNEFNMASTLDNSSCGTIGCIAGWANHISGGVAFPEIVAGEIEGWMLRSIELQRAFGIGRVTGALFSITPDQAATALRSYLTTGDARWELAVQT